VLIVISKGPDLVEIPDIVGKSINEAGQLLRNAGFAVNTDNVDVNEAFWDIAEVQDYEPGGPTAKRGSTISLYSHYD
jgi:serine/threonine-protein kinase